MSKKNCRGIWAGNCQEQVDICMGNSITSNNLFQVMTAMAAKVKKWKWWTRWKLWSKFPTCSMSSCYGTRDMEKSVSTSSYEPIGAKPSPCVIWAGTCREQVNISMGNGITWNSPFQVMTALAAKVNKWTWRWRSWGTSSQPWGRGEPNLWWRVPFQSPCHTKISQKAACRPRVKCRL